MTGTRILDGLLIFLMACFLFGFGMNGRALRRNSEARVARVAQEAIERDEWVVGYFNGQPRLQKPPASSWPVALSAIALNEGRVRPFDALLPTALSGALLVALIYWWLSGAGGERGRVAGLLGAFFLATMAAVLGQARSAEMDIHIALFSTLAFFGLERHRLYGKRWGLPVCYLALGLGILVKGHVVLVIFLPAALIWRFWPRSKPLSASPKHALIGHLIGFALLLLVVLPWAIPFLQKSGFAFSDFWKEGVDRFSDSTGHGEDWHYYLREAWGWTLPAVLLLPFVIGSRWNRPMDQGTPARWLWWMWLLVNLVVWSCVTAKQRHYAVPWLIPLALVLGEGFAAMLARAREGTARASDRWGSRALVVFGVLLGVGSFVLVAVAPEMNTPPVLRWALAVIAATAFIMGSSALHIQLERGFFECWWIGALCLLLIYAATFEAHRDLSESPAGFCTQVADVVPLEATLYDADLVGRKAIVLYYLGRNVTPIAELKPGETYQEFLDRLVSATIDKLRCEPGCYVLTYSTEDRHGGLHGVKPRLPEALYKEAIPCAPRFMDHQRLNAHLLKAEGE